MYFQLPRECEKWFAHIFEGNYSTKWDMFYLCLMAGFAAGKPLPYEARQVSDLVDHYPGEFKSRGHLLVGLLLITELQSRAIGLEERDSVYRNVAKIVQSGSPSYMKDEGVKLMNQYAFSGFKVIRDYFDGEKPRSIEVFLRKYARCIRDTIGARTSASSSSPKKRQRRVDKDIGPRA